MRGDILVVISSGVNVDETDGYFVLEYEVDTARYVMNGDGLSIDFDNVYGYECEVIGNIHDNPELLEVEE